MSLHNLLPSCDIVTTGTLLVCLVAFYAAYITIRRSTSRLPPGPVGLPFIGNLLIFLRSKEHPHDLMWRLTVRYGKVRLNVQVVPLPPRGGGHSRIYKYTANGSFFHEKSLDMGSLFGSKILRHGSIFPKCSTFWVFAVQNCWSVCMAKF